MIAAGCDGGAGVPSDFPPATPEPPAPRCGDGVIDPGESCDLGTANGPQGQCTPRCAVPSCGDGFVAASESCDDGNRSDGDGCSGACADESAPVWEYLAPPDPELGGPTLARLVAPTADGGIVILVNAPFDPDERDRLPLIWIDADGAVVNTTNGDLNTPALNLEDLTITTDGHVALAGAAVNLDGFGVFSPMVAMMDRSGRVLWSIIDDEIEYGMAEAVVPTSDGGVVAVGDRENNLWVRRYDADGEIVWQNPDIQTGFQFAEHVGIADDDSIVIMGEGGGTWLEKYDATGQSLWRLDNIRILGTAESFDTRDLAVDHDGTIYVLYRRFEPGEDPLFGQDVPEGFRVDRFDSDGRWQQMLTPASLPPLARADGLQVEHGGVLVTGRAGVPERRHAWLWTADRDGDNQGLRTYQRTPTLPTDINDATWTTDGRIAVAGDDQAPLLFGAVWAAVFTAPVATAAPSSDLTRSPLQGPLTLNADTNPTPDGGDLRETPPPPPPHHSTLYLDFDGEWLTPGDVAADGQGTCVDHEFFYPPFRGSQQDAETIVERVRQLVSPFGLRVTSERPPRHLPYSVMMVGGGPEDFERDEAFNGLACRTDCGDEQRTDIAFVFADKFDDPATVAEVVTHEAGHLWGLDHVDGPSNMMFPLLQTSTHQWADDCVPLDDSIIPRCPERHVGFCRRGSQNAVSELMARFGPPEVDFEPPEAAIVSPLTGTWFPAGAPIRVEVDVVDDFNAPGWMLSIPELDWSVAADHGETQFDLQLPPGRHWLLLDAIDHDGNASSDEILIIVGKDIVSPGEPDLRESGGLEEPPGACRVSDRPMAGWSWILLTLCAIRRGRGRARAARSRPWPPAADGRRRPRTAARPPRARV